MADLEKFMFEVSFDDATIAEAEAEAAEELAASEESFELMEDIPTFTEDQMDAARDEGFEAGKEAGIREAADAIETKINDALSMIGGNLEELFKRQTIDIADTFSDAVNIAVAIASKSFPHLNEAHGFAEIERMVKEVLTEVLEEPRVIIHIHSSLKETLDDRISDMAKESNFEGQIIILEADDLGPGDCRVTWSSGSAERDMEGTLGKIDQIVRQNLGSVKEEVVEQVEINGVDIQPTSAPEEAAAAALGESVAPVSTPEPEIPASAPVVAVEQPADAVPSEPAAMEPEGAPPTPSAELMEDSPDPAEAADTLASDALEDEMAEAVDAVEEAGDTSQPDLPPSDPDAMIEAHLQAGPGSMEPDPNEAILETEPDDDPVAEETADAQEADDGTPPPGPNV